eukprot:6656995-Pyramimonas_sp.AAC.1
MVNCVVEANAALRRLKSAIATTTIKSKGFSRLRLVAPCGLGFAFEGAGQGRPRTGGLIRAADKDLLLGKGAD